MDPARRKSSVSFGYGEHGAIKKPATGFHLCAGMGMEPLKVGATGPLVEQWEIFLRGQDLLTDKEVDTHYTEATRAATKLFQGRYPQLNSDGIAGNGTIGYAMAHHGFEIFELSSPDFPAQPKDAVAMTFDARQKLLGEIRYMPAPTPDNPEAIRIVNGWKQQFLTTVTIPQLRGVSGASSSGAVEFNKLVAKQFQALFVEWQTEGLSSRILSWGGTFAPRFIRGSRTILSQHAHASAFDLNVPWNALGTRGALVGEKGCARELVLAAYRHGFFWGGWFTRKDPMHFEVFKIL